MYKTGMIIAVCVLVVGWIGYGIYKVIIGQREKKNPGKKAQNLGLNTSFEDYSQKMAEHEREVSDSE